MDSPPAMTTTSRHSPLHTLVVLAGLIPTWTMACEFSGDLWPGEGRPVVETTQTIIEVFEEPTSTGAAEQVEIIPGSELEFERTFFCTKTPGEIELLKPIVVTGRELPSGAHLSRSDYYGSSSSITELSLQTGQIVEYLQYRAEGYCIIRLDNRVFESDLCMYSGGTDTKVSQSPDTALWVEITIGRVTGWVEVDEESVKMVRREF